jgi:hypothetical protein
MAENNVFTFQTTFRTLERKFNPAFTKIVGSNSGSLSSKLDGCLTSLNESGKIVCGRQIEPISDDFIKGLFKK